MKIVIIGSAHPLRGGGISTFNERLATALSLANEVQIYSFSLQYPSFLFPGKNQFTEEPAPPGLSIYSLINSINPLNWITVGKRLRKEQPDLIIVRYWLPFMAPAFGTILRSAKKNKAVRVIGIMDNVIPHEKRPGDRLLTKYFLKPIDAFVCMSREVLKDIHQLEQLKPAAYTPHPVYDTYGPSIPKGLAREKLGLHPEGKYILFFGFIRKYKGLDLLLQAMADPRIRHSGIRLIVAGEFYDNEADYRQLINSLGIGAQLDLFTEFIPNAAVSTYFSAADCVVQPYRTATQSGISQIAYHFEKPMIVTNVGGLPEIVPDGKAGFVTEVSEVAIADAILRFYTHHQENEFAIHLRTEKKKYSWHHFTQKLMDLYQKIKTG